MVHARERGQQQPSASPLHHPTPSYALETLNKEICPQRKATVAFRLDLIWLVLHVVVNGGWLTTDDVK